MYFLLKQINNLHNTLGIYEGKEDAGVCVCVCVCVKIPGESWWSGEKTNSTLAEDAGSAIFKVWLWGSSLSWPGGAHLAFSSYCFSVK
jgi:hypothetical protein